MLLRGFSACLWLICPLFIGLFPASGWSAPVKKLEQVNLQLKWRHQFQFAGYYAAQQKGFFREEGLDVTLKQGGPDISPLTEVMEGRAQYAVEAGELVYYRLQGKPVVALAAIFQHSPAVLMTLQKSGLRTPHDLAHKRIGILTGGQPSIEMAAMFVNEGIPLDALMLRPNGVGLDDLLNDRLDADFGYVTTAAYLNQKHELHYILPVNYGTDFYGDTLFTSERQVQEYPVQVAALRRAVLRGWEYALNNPQEIIDLMLKQYPGLDREALRFEAAQMRDLIQPDIVSIGHMNPERWLRMADTFIKLKMLGDTSRLEGFLYDPKQAPDYHWLMWGLGVIAGLTLLGFIGGGIVAWSNGRLQQQNELLQEVMLEREKTSHLLEESQRMLQNLIGNLPGMVYRCHCDRNWTMEYVSEGCEKLTGYPPAFFQGKWGRSFNYLIHPDDQERLWAGTLTAVGRKHPFQVTYRIRHKDGSWHWVWEQGNCVQRNEQGEPLFLEGLIMDITSQVETQEKLKEAKEKADRATRAKSLFLANISHEIRTPLTAVTGFSQLLQQSGQEGRQREYVEELYNSSQLLLGIVEGLIDFSCIEAGDVVLRPMPFNLQGILRSIRHVVKSMLEDKGLCFQIEVDDSIPLVLVGDPLRLSQVLNNLVCNAVKFTRKGSVSLNVSLLGRTEHEVNLRFGVRDTGVGIPAGQRDKLFEPFVRINPGVEGAAKGAGLGLAISRHLVELMGGTIKLDSVYGIGSEFSFCVSFGIGTDTGAELKRETEEALASLAGAHILVVDDEPLNRMIAVELLKILGCSTESAENAAGAIQALESGLFQAVLMDIEMPGMRGHELTHQLRQDPRWRRLPIIALTAHATTDARDAYLSSGMDDYLSKPFNLEQLRDMLLKWLGKTRQTAGDNQPQLAGEKR